jgi:hypothetical protein
VKHYKETDPTYEAINVIEAWGADFNIGNALKYIARHQHKGAPQQDLQKAIWYLERAIQRLDAGATYSASQYDEDQQAPAGSATRPSISEEVQGLFRKRPDQVYRGFYSTNWKLR